MSGKTFILGVGAEKAGSTWLFRYLGSSPGVATTVLKEFHVWDTLYLPEFADLIVDEVRRHQHPRLELRWQRQRDPEGYFAYFAQLLETTGAVITCDVTPSYSALPAEAYERIKAGFAPLGIRVKTIFIMRDPVQRCRSAAGMLHNVRRPGTPLTDEEVVEHALSPAGRARTRYEVTLPRLAAAFGPDRLHLGLYEEMHSPPMIDALSHFCGIPANQDFAGERVFATKGLVTLAEETAARIARHYRAAYEAAAAVFPQARALWPGFRYL